MFNFDTIKQKFDDIPSNRQRQIKQALIALLWFF